MGSICKSAKTVEARKYWVMRSPTIEKITPRASFKDIKQIIKLEFTIENIEKNHRYQIKVNFKGENSFKTEKVLSQMPIITFNTCYIGDYYFERQQLLNISLEKDEVHKGSINISLGGIVGSIGSVYKGMINDVTIKIAAQGINQVASFVSCRFEAKHSSQINNFRQAEDKIHFLITSGAKKIYSSESIKSNGVFNIVNIPADLLSKGFGVQFFDGYQDPITYKDENIQQFCIPKNEIYLGITANNKRINIYNKSIFFKNVNFIDYIKAGIKIKLSIGIDYTSSNGLPNEPKSLHYLGDHMNDYEQAIEACGTIVAYYDYNQKFPVYGYGALINGQGDVNMCFKVNFKQDPEIHTIDNVLKEYRNSFQFLQLAGPTNFYPLIKRVVDNIRHDNNSLIYHILLILTDGIINDLGQTIDILVEGSFLPLSVIIIGIGNDNFEEMVVLDGDDNPLIDSNGVKRMRDLVQFVPFNRFKNNPTKLAEEVLEEVPRQVIEYYAMNKLYPDNLSRVSGNNTQKTDVNPISRTYNY